jgi:hypothetical protein
MSANENAVKQQGRQSRYSAPLNPNYIAAQPQISSGPSRSSTTTGE